jgi:hypothetical protein
VLNVRDGSLPAITEEEGVNPDWIKILSYIASRRLQLKKITPNHLSGSPMPLWRCHVSYASSILAPKNIDVDEINNAILELLFEELHTYLSADSLVLTEEGASAVIRVLMDSLYLVEF